MKQQELQSIIAERLNEFFTATGLTSSIAATLTGITEDRIGQFLAAKGKTMEVFELVRISKYTLVSCDFLIGRSTQMFLPWADEDVLEAIINSRVK